jgi:EmrB/QacA subfamily drug resistance transporter
MDSTAVGHGARIAPTRAPSPNMVLAVLMVGTFLAPLDSSIVNIALPSIAAHLHVTLTAVSWVATAYLLTSAALLLSMGRVGDMWGLRNLYVWGLLIFGVGSAACAMSQTLTTLMAARVLQAVGASMLFAAGPAIVVRTFPPDKRGAALGIISLAVAAGLTVGPALGGVLVGLFGWQSIFLINIPLSVIAAGIAWRVLAKEEAAGESFDMLGAVLAGGALLSLLGAVTEVGTYGLASIEIIGALAATVVLGVAFVRWERKATHPMVDMRLFRSKGFSAGLGVAVLAYMTMFSVIFTMPFYLLRAKALPPTAAGLLLTATPLAMAVLAPFVGRLTDRIGSHVLSAVGLLVLSAGLVVISMLHQASPVWFIGVSLFVVGSGMAIFQTPNTTAVMQATPRARAGVGSAFIAEARNVGMMLGIALTAAVVTSRMGVSAAALDGSGLLQPLVAARLVDGMALAMRLSAALALVAAAVSWFLRDDTASKVEQGRQGG